MSDDNFLSRWSRRKHEAKKEPTPAAPADPPGAALPGPAAISPTASEAAVGPAEAGALPPLDSLTPESDFAPFMRDQVDHGMRRAALKTLFQDPRFNVMDGLDVYIDDYSKPDPLPEGWLEKMRGFAALDDHKVLDPRTEAKAEDGAAVSEEPRKIEAEQPLAQGPEIPPADTPDAGSKPPQLRES